MQAQRTQYGRRLSYRCVWLSRQDVRGGGKAHFAFAFDAETATTGLQVNQDATQRAASQEPKPVDIQALMNSDPRFIARLIQQLDTQMHNMQDEKRRRQEAIAADTEEMNRIDKEIATHIQPRLVE